MEWLSSLCTILALLMELIVVPVCVVWLIITIVKKKDIKLPRNVLIGCVVAFIVFNGIGRATWVSPEDEVNTEDTSQDTLADADDSESETEKDTSTQKDSETEEIAELSEEEYKALCKEMYRNELFYGDRGLYGEKVKLYLKVDEHGSFLDYLKPFSSYDELNDEYHLKDDIFWAYVLGETSTVYSGARVEVYFSEDYGVDALDYEVGQEIVVYADVIGFSFSWEGADGVCIIPRYIEIE